MTRPTIIAGNWKLNPPRAQGERLYRDIVAGIVQRAIDPARARVVVCPPAPYLGSLRPEPGIALGAQDLSIERWGAFTGDLSGELLREFGCRHVIIGHSERRHLRGETDEMVARKVSAACAAGLEPILCVGETEAERDADETFEVVSRQLRRALEQAVSDRTLTPATPMAVAYEPVWAIGTGRTASPAQAAEVHRYLRNRLREFARVFETRGVEKSRAGAQGAAPDAWEESVPVLYGGSVKPDNAAALLADPDIDGALIGGASLEAGSFLAILDAVPGPGRAPS